MITRKKTIKQKFNDNIDEIFMVLGLSSFVVFGIGLRNIDNYTHWLAFSITLIFTGLIIGLVMYYFLSLFIVNIKNYKNSNNINMKTLLLVCFSFLSFGIGITLNESFSNKSNCDRYMIYKMGESGSRSRGYYVFINNGRKSERLSFGEDFNHAHKVGDRIDLCLVTGCLGFEYYKVNTKK